MPGRDRLPEGRQIPGADVTGRSRCRRDGPHNGHARGLVTDAWIEEDDESVFPSIDIAALAVARDCRFDAKLGAADTTYRVPIRSALRQVDRSPARMYGTCLRTRGVSAIVDQVVKR